MKFSGSIFSLALAGLISASPALAADPAPPAPPPVAPVPLDLHPVPVMIAPAEATPQVYGPAPKPGAVAPEPKDPKARKAARKEAKELRRMNTANCLNKSVSNSSAPLLAQLLKQQNLTSLLRTQPRIGLPACDALLALPADEDDQWDRRAVLLQSRAAHLIGLGAFDVAIQSLDEADAIGAARNDMLFEGGVGVGNAMLRAYALGKLGKKDEARAEIARGRAFRPHATALDRGFDRIANNLDNSIDGMLATSATKIKWNPDLMRGMLPLYIWRSDMEGAALIADDVSTINPKPIGGWTMSGAQSPGAQLSDDIEMQLQRAYIWAAVGNLEKSSAIVSGTQADIAEFVGIKPVAEAGRKVPQYKMREYEARVEEGKGIERLVERWQLAIRMRADTATVPGEELFVRAADTNIAGLVVGLDLLRHFRFTDPKQAEDAKRLLAKAEASISDDILKLDAGDLRDLVPDPEYLSQVPRFGNAGDGILFGRENGISQAKEKGSDIRTVRFGTTSGTAAMADELALLAIAQYAQKEGKDSFILLARRSIKRTTTVSGYYTAGYSFDSGYESQARVVLLDSTNLPPEWSDKQDRLIMVKQVMDEIKPRYDALEARKAADKAKER